MKEMKEMIITATFKGQNGSLGYKTGKEYKLRMTHPKSGFIDIQDISFRNPAGYCQYGSMIAFMQNWTNVKDVTALQPKRDLKEYAINFTDFCKKNAVSVISSSVKSTTKSALDFYNEEFTPEKVMYYFQNWSMEKSDKRYRDGVILTNNNTTGWKVKIWINDGGEYTFCSGSDGTDKPEKSLSWIYYPKTMSEFISDCLRHEDVELLLRPRAIKKIYG